MNTWIPRDAPPFWCALCGEHYVRVHADYSCPMCPPELPCPTSPVSPLSWLATARQVAS